MSSIAWSLMSDRRRGALVDEAAGAEAFEREGFVELVRAVVGDGVGEDPARARRRLEAASAPAAIDEEPVDGGEADDRAGVGRAIDDAGPLPQHAQPADDGEKLDERRELLLDDRQAAALGVGIVVVARGAD